MGSVLRDLSASEASGVEAGAAPSASHRHERVAIRQHGLHLWSPMGRRGLLAFVCHFSKMVHLAPVAAEVTADDSAELFLELVFRHHGLPESIVSDRDLRFTSAFWTRLLQLLGTRLLMSTVAHPETDGQTERVNRVLEDVLRSYATSLASWSSFLPMAEFALNNATHSSTGLTPFFVNNERYPRVPSILDVRGSTKSAVSTLGGGRLAPTVASTQTSSDLPPTEGYIWRTTTYARLTRRRPPRPDPTLRTSRRKQLRRRSTRLPSLTSCCVTRFVRDALQVAVDKQNENADRRGLKNMSSFRRGDRVLLSTEGIQGTVVTNLGANKLAPRFIGPFKILKVLGDAYTIYIPTAMRLHPTFYVGRLKPYDPATIPEPDPPRPQQARNRRSPDGDAGVESARALAPPARASQNAARHS